MSKILFIWYSSTIFGFIKYILSELFGNTDHWRQIYTQTSPTFRASKITFKVKEILPVWYLTIVIFDYGLTNPLIIIWEILHTTGLLKLLLGSNRVQKTKTSIYEISRMLFSHMDFSFVHFVDFNFPILKLKKVLS